MLWTPNFAKREWLVTGTGLPNAFSSTEHEAAARDMAVAILQPLRDRLGRAVRITSGYRTLAINSAVRGARNSQHMRGEAVDIVVAGLTSREVWAHVLEMRAAGFRFDQAILYEDRPHLHLSHVAKTSPRKQLLVHVSPDWRGDSFVSWDGYVRAGGRLSA